MIKIFSYILWPHPIYLFILTLNNINYCPTYLLIISHLRWLTRFVLMVSHFDLYGKALISLGFNWPTFWKHEVTKCVLGISVICMLCLILCSYAFFVWVILKYIGISKDKVSDGGLYLPRSVALESHLTWFHL